MDENGERNPYRRDANEPQNTDAENGAGYSQAYDPNGYTQNPYGVNQYPNGQDYGYDPRYGYQQPQQPPYGYDPRYGYQQPRRPQYGDDPRYGNDPRFGNDPQQYDYRQPQQPQQPPYGYDPRAPYGYTQNPYEQPQGYGYRQPQQPPQPQYGYDPNAQGYAQEQYDPRRGEYGYPDDRPNDTDEPYREDDARGARQENDRPTYENDAPFDEDTPDERPAYGRDDEDEAIEERPRKRTSKRSPVQKLLRAAGMYISELPAKTLAVFGGVVAILIVGIVLLTVLLPKGDGRAPQDISDGQINLAEFTPPPTPTPSLPPAVTPEQQALPEETPFVDPLDGIMIKTIGDTNDVIPAVQERLVELGYMEKPEDGYTTKYGTATKKAIRIFQVKNYEDSRDWDGILGSGTYKLLMSDEAKGFYLKKGDGGKETEELTDLVNAVKQLQERLIQLGYMTDSPSSVYGSSTAEAVKLFQSYNGLEADGVAGQATLALLYSNEALTAAQGAANPKPRPSAAVEGAESTEGTQEAGAAAQGETPAE